jgi:hypothetical protein
VREKIKEKCSPRDISVSFLIEDSKENLKSFKKADIIYIESKEKVISYLIKTG